MVLGNKELLGYQYWVGQDTAQYRVSQPNTQLLRQIRDTKVVLSPFSASNITLVILSGNLGIVNFV